MEQHVTLEILLEEKHEKSDLEPTKPMIEESCIVGEDLEESSDPELRKLIEETSFHEDFIRERANEVVPEMVITPLPSQKHQHMLVTSYAASTKLFQNNEIIVDKGELYVSTNSITTYSTLNTNSVLLIDTNTTRNTNASNLTYSSNENISPPPKPPEQPNMYEIQPLLFSEVLDLGRKKKSPKEPPPIMISDKTSISSPPLKPPDIILSQSPQPRFVNISISCSEEDPRETEKFKLLLVKEWKRYLKDMKNWIRTIPAEITQTTDPPPKTSQLVSCLSQPLIHYHTRKRNMKVIVFQFDTRISTLLHNFEGHSDTYPGLAGFSFDNSQTGRGLHELDAKVDEYVSYDLFYNDGQPQTYGDCFVDSLVAEVEKDKDIVVVRAGITSELSLELFQEKVSDRIFNMGVAEQYAVTLVSGLSSGRLKPFCIIQSSLLQRAYDQVVHDVDQQKIPVRFVITSARLVGLDGPVQCGEFDITFMSCLPNMIVMALSDKVELVHMETTDASDYAFVVMPSAKGMVPVNQPYFIGTYWGAVRTIFYTEIIDSADAYLFVGPIFNDSNYVGYLFLFKKEKVIILQPDSVVIGNGPVFGFEIMEDLLKAHANNNASYENYHRIYSGWESFEACTKRTFESLMLCSNIYKRCYLVKLW